MRLKEFSDKSVKQAEAAFFLGFDTIEKYTTQTYAQKITKIHVVMRNINTSCELSPKFFPELDNGDCVSVHYIANYKEINELYKKYGMYQD